MRWRTSSIFDDNDDNDDDDEEEEPVRILCKSSRDRCEQRAAGHVVGNMGRQVQEVGDLLAHAGTINSRLLVVHLD